VEPVQPPSDATADAAVDLIVIGDGVDDLARQEGIATDSGTAAPTPTVVWATQSKGTGPRDCFPEDVAADAAGNTYVVGRFSGSVDFGVKELTAEGGTDAFLVKYNPNGKALWVRTIGSKANDGAEGVSLALDGDVLVTGYVGGPVTFVSAPTIHHGDADAFVARLSATATPRWLTTIGGSGTDAGQDVVDQTGAVRVVGKSVGTILTGTQPDIKSTTGNGKSDGFVATLDSLGKPQSLFTLGGNEVDRLAAAAVDSKGDLVVAGEYSASLTIGMATPTSQGGTDLLIVRYTAAGPSTVVALGGAGSDQLHDMALSEKDSIYLVGNFFGQADLSSGMTGQPAKTNGFLVKRQGNGMNAWARVTETGTAAELNGVALDLKGRPGVVGSYQGSLTVEGNTHTAQGTQDVVVAGYGTGSKLHWLETYGGKQTSAGRGIAADGLGHYYAVGHFQGSVTFGTHTLGADVGSSDMFLIKLKPPAPSP